MATLCNCWIGKTKKKKKKTNIELLFSLLSLLSSFHLYLHYDIRKNEIEIVSWHLSVRYHWLLPYLPRVYCLQMLCSFRLWNIQMELLRFANWTCLLIWKWINQFRNGQAIKLYEIRFKKMLNSDIMVSFRWENVRIESFFSFVSFIWTGYCDGFYCQSVFVLLLRRKTRGNKYAECKQKKIMLTINYLLACLEN